MTTATAQRSWVPTPPGWVEIAAFDTDARAERHWREMIEPARRHLGEEQTDHLYRGLREVREAVGGTGVTSAGVVVTQVDDAPAIWTFSTTIERVDSGELSPVGLVERAVGTVGTVDELADITLVDGRTAVQALLTLTPGSPMAGRGPAGAASPAGDGEVGVCVIAVALPRRPRELVLVTGSSTVLEHRALLAHVASAIACGVHVGSEPPEGVARAHAVVAYDDSAAELATGHGTDGVA